MMIHHIQIPNLTEFFKVRNCQNCGEELHKGTPSLPAILGKNGGVYCSYNCEKEIDND